MKFITLEANAKLNIGLSIYNQRDNGFHDISSHFQEINWCDNIEIKLINTSNINFYTTGIAVPDNKDNICVQAALLFNDKYNIHDGVSINLVKNIPVGAGLGGGSSDAAAIIKGLYKLHNIPFCESEAIALCKNIGSDVPFFINGGLQYLEGIGSELSPLPPYFKDYIFLIVYPNINISTSWAYSQYKIYLDNQSAYNKFGPLQVPINWESFYNDFDKVVLSAYPEIRCIKQTLNDCNCLLSNLSGSGSAVFGIFENQDLAEKAKSQFENYQTYISLPVY